MQKWFKEQSAEFQAKAAKCKSNEEFLALAGNEGIQLPDEIMDGVAGGSPLSWRPYDGIVVYP